MAFPALLSSSVLSGAALPDYVALAFYKLCMYTHVCARACVCLHVCVASSNCFGCQSGVCAESWSNVAGRSCFFKASDYAAVALILDFVCV